MAELAWPVTACENPKCGFNLSKVEPREKERSLSEDGSRKPMWSDFCPGCGRGYVVGVRIIPQPRTISSLSEPEKPIPPPSIKDFFDITAKVEPEPEHEPEVVLVDEVKPLPSDLLAEGYKTMASEQDEFAKISEDAVREALPIPTETHQEVTTDPYFCTKCNITHRATSKSGLAHLSFKKEG